jgi:hypothetical protein
VCCSWCHRAQLASLHPLGERIEMSRGPLKESALYHKGSMLATTFPTSPFVVLCATVFSSRFCTRWAMSRLPLGPSASHFVSRVPAYPYPCDLLNSETKQKQFKDVLYIFEMTVGCCVFAFGDLPFYLPVPCNPFYLPTWVLSTWAAFLTSLFRARYVTLFSS